MKRNSSILYLMLICMLLFVNKTHAVCKKYIKVKGIVTLTSSYCGGARPSDEMLENLQKPKPASGKILYIKIGSSNMEKSPIFQKVICNDMGEFELSLKKGQSYIFIEEWKSIPFALPKDTEYIKWDAACFKKSYETPDFLLDTKKDKNMIVKINYHQPCFFNPYCGKYSGPLPP